MKNEAVGILLSVLIGVSAGVFILVHASVAPSGSGVEFWVRTKDAAIEFKFQDEFTGLEINHTPRKGEIWAAQSYADGKIPSWGRMQDPRKNDKIDWGILRVSDLGPEAKFYYHSTINNVSMMISPVRFRVNAALVDKLIASGGFLEIGSGDFSVTDKMSDAKIITAKSVYEKSFGVLTQ